MLDSLRARACVPARLALALTAVAALAWPAPATAQTRSGVEPDPAVRAWPIGRIVLDGGVYREDLKAMSNGTEFRNARLGVHGVIAERWEFEVEADIDDEELDVMDLWAATNFEWGGRLQIGQFKEPFSLEELTSSRFLTLMERALPNAFAPGRSMGVALTIPTPMVWAAAGVFGQDVDDVGEDDLGVSEGWAATARVAARWQPDSTAVVHVGASGTRRTANARTDREGRVRFRAYPEAHVDRTRYLHTGWIDDLDHVTKGGLEAAVVWRSVSVQAEHIVSRVTQTTGTPAPSFDGSYAVLSWIPTGEHRPYDPALAEFGSVQPRGDRGAIELALRYSRIDLNDADAGVEGGAATQWTAGVNWYASRQVRVSLNHVWVDNDVFADGDGDFAGDDDPRILLARFQIWF